MEHTPIPLTLLAPERGKVDRLFFRLTWRRMRGARRRVGFFVGAAVWPLWSAYLAGRLVRRRGEEIRDKHGVSRFRQWFDQVASAVVSGRPPHIYYFYSLYENENRYVSSSPRRSFGD